MSQMTIHQALDIAVRHHQAGQFQQAEMIYRQILAVEPNQFDALHLLGVIAHQVGRHDLAIEYMGRAIAVSPNSADALANLAEAYKAAGKFDESVATSQKAIALKPNGASYCNMGNVLYTMGRRAEAKAAYQQAVALDPGYANAHNNLGAILREEGRIEEAVASLRQAIAHRSDYAEAYSNLGNMLRELGRPQEAVVECRKAIAIAPNLPEGLMNLGIVLCELREIDEALAVLRKAVALNPNYADAHLNLGVAFKEKGFRIEAIAAYRKAIELKPAYATAFNNLGNVLREEGQFDEAIASLKKAIALDSNYAHAYANLGIAYKDACMLDESVDCMRKAIALKASTASTHSGLLLILLCHPATTRRTIFEESRRWNEMYAPPPEKEFRPHANDRNPDRRLRVGYVSLDFREHPVGRFLTPFLSNHDKSQFEVFAYAHVEKPDSLTQMHRKQVSVWRDIVRLDDAQLAEKVREDGIDILVDLSLHTSQNRLLALARKPAPVQMTWLGYPGGTGMPAIDYRLTDPYLDPMDIDESLYAEKTIRLADTFWCYDPLDGREAQVSPLPAEKNGFITFGCLNNFTKMTPQVIELWGRVMQQLERSRLILLACPGSHWQRTLDLLGKFGVGADRVEHVAYMRHRDYLETYRRIDVGLDSFPYNGHTTSLDSIWMGVPVVTLVGELPVARAGWSQLSNLKMTELAADSPERFVEIAVKLARDIPRLSALRASLRGRMENSPLMDSKKHVADIESIYRRIWRAWCESRGA